MSRLQRAGFAPYPADIGGSALSDIARKLQFDAFGTFGSQFSVGIRAVPTVVAPSPRLSELVPEIAALPPPPPPPEIDRRDSSPLQSELPSGLPNVIPRDYFEYWERVNAGEQNVPLPAAGSPTIEPPYRTIDLVGANPDDIGIYQPTAAQRSTGETSMDLGQILTDLGTTYIQSRYGQAAPPSVQTAGYSAADLLGLTTPGGGIPGVDIIPEPQAANCGGGSPVYKKVCGAYKWVYPKRRRRKALVTKKDITGLAQLKGVLGMGKAMETWIATHS